MNARVLQMAFFPRPYPFLAGIGLLDRLLVAFVLFLVMLLAGVGLAQSAQLIPSIGITRAVDDQDDSARISGGLALRGSIAPFLMAEIGGSYRSERRSSGDLNITQWPITGSLWLEPVPMLYAGGGVGWYQTTLDYRDTLPLTDETRQQFGVHLGGGVSLPVMAALNLDLNGRYVFLGDVNQKLSTETFDPDYWTTSLGLAIKF